MIISLPIPSEAHVLVKAGEKVDFSSKIFEIPVKEFININIAQKLNVPPEKIFTYLKKFVGEEIKKNDLLAYKKGFLGDKKVYSEYNGVLKEINHQIGEIIIEVDDKKTQEKKETNSPLVGEIEEIEKGVLKIKIKKGKTIEIKEKNNYNFGAGVFILERIDQILAENVEKKLIVADEIKSVYQTKCEALGALGFLTLKKLPNPTNLPTFQFKNIDDINKIKKEIFSYCFIEKNSSKIIFYD